MAITVKGVINNEVITLEHTNRNFYEVEQKAPKQELKTTTQDAYYPISITAADDTGNVSTDNKTLLNVKNNFVFDFIAATPAGEEISYLITPQIDVDIGDTNDFQLTVSAEEYREEIYGYRNLIYIPDTEYGGIIEDLEVSTKSNTVILRGLTWRGLLMQKVVEPPEGEDNLKLNGELNECIRELLGIRFHTLFTADDTNTGVYLSNWVVDRYVTLYGAIMKFLDEKGFRLQIRYQQGTGVETGCVHLQAIPVKDYSEELEYSQDNNVNFSIRDNRVGINHLICAGGGEGAERILLHLYVQENGSIGKTRFYTGLAERTSYYDYGNAKDIEELEKNGIKQLQELQNYKKLEMSVDNIDLEIGDIVGGRERITGMELKKPVIQKIFKLTDGKVSIAYKLKGAD